MIRNYRDLTRLEMEQVDKKETIILIPLGALEQHGNQAPLGTDDIIAEAMVKYLGEELEALYPDCEIEVNSGGQPIYYYIISVE